MRITRKHQKTEYPYKLHDVVLESTAHERDLGVWTSSNLTWTKHVEEQCIQSTKMLGYIRRSTLDIKNISVRRTIFNSSTLKTMLWVSIVGTTIRGADQMHGKNPETSEQVHPGSTIHLRC